MASTMGNQAASFLPLGIIFTVVMGFTSVLLIRSAWLLGTISGATATVFLALAYAHTNTAWIRLLCVALVTVNLVALILNVMSGLEMR